MATLNRRRFLLLSAVALMGAACSSTEAAGLRGNGRTFVPRDETPAAPTPALEPTPSLRPTLVPVPTAVPEPIVAPDALPTLTAGSTDAEMHVVPVLSGKPPLAAALPARRLVVPTPGLVSKGLPLGTKIH